MLLSSPQSNQRPPSSKPALSQGACYAGEIPALIPPNETHAQKTARRKNNAEAIALSNAIDDAIGKEIEERRSSRGSVARVLLFGLAGSGKSTVLKHMKLNYSPSQWQAERMFWRVSILFDLARAIHLLVGTMHEYSRRYPNISFPAFREGNTVAIQQAISQLAPLLRANYLSAAATDVLGRISEDILRCQEDIETLWQDKAVQTVLTRKLGISQDERHNVLVDDLKYYIDNLPRICSQDYVPTNEDIFKAHPNTAGVEEHRIKLDVSSHDFTKSFMIYDIPENTSKYSEDMDMVIFHVPLVDDTHLLLPSEEHSLLDPERHPLREALDVWAKVVSSHIIRQSNITLLLTKFDLLEKFFARRKTAWDGRWGNAHAYIREFKDRFHRLYRENTPSGGRCLRTYVISAQDQEGIAVVLAHIKDEIQWARRRP